MSDFLNNSNISVWFESFLSSQYFQAFIFFVVGYFIAKAIAWVSQSVMKKTGLSEKIAKNLSGGNYTPKKIESGTGSTFFWAVMLFVLVGVLENLGVEHAITPLNGLLEKVFGFVPHVIAAGLLTAVAFIASKVTRTVLNGFFSGIDLDNRFGLNKLNSSDVSVSKVLATTASTFVFLLLIPTALRALNLTSISAPIESVIDSIFSTFPNILVAIAIFSIGLYLATIVRSVLRDILSVSGINEWPAKIGMSSLSNVKGQTPSRILSQIVFVSIVVLMFTQAVSALELGFLSTMTASFTTGYFHVLGGAIILAVGWVLATFTGNALGKETVWGKVAKWGILLVAITMALHKANFAPEITSYTFQVFVTAIGIALGLGGAIAIGWGARETVGSYMRSWSNTNSSKVNSKEKSSINL